MQVLPAFGKENHFTSQSAFYQVLNAVSDGVFKRKCLIEK